MLVVSLEAKALNHNMFYYSGPLHVLRCFSTFLWRLGLHNINNNFLFVHRLRNIEKWNNRRLEWSNMAKSFVFVIRLCIEVTLSVLKLATLFSKLSQSYVCRSKILFRNGIGWREAKCVCPCSRFLVYKWFSWYRTLLIYSVTYWKHCLRRNISVEIFVESSEYNGPLVKISPLLKCLTKSIISPS